MSQIKPPRRMFSRACRDIRTEDSVHHHARLWRLHMSIQLSFLLCMLLMLLSGCSLSWIDVTIQADAASGSSMLNTEQSLISRQDSSPSDGTPDQSSHRITIPLTPALSEGSRTATEIFNSVSPGVVFIETPNSSGSGIWLAPGYLVSNAHVVWPYESVSRVVFPNGEEHLDVPIIGWDLMADLAILGPIETDVEPQAFASGDELEIGSDIYLIGYPGEMEEFPEPTLTQGVLSRIRDWKTIDLSFFQVDAAIAGGQSGGVLVTGTGDIVGISTFSFTEAGFGLVASAHDIVGRLENIINAENEPSIMTRKLLTGNPIKSDLIRLTPDVDARQYLIAPIADGETEIELSVTGRGNPAMYVSSLTGYDYEEADISNGVTKLKFRPEAGVPYIVEIWHDAPFGGSYQLTSNIGLVSLRDEDDGKKLSMEKVYIGNIDHPYDLDTFNIALDEGQIVTINADSLSIDPYLSISYESERKAETYEDDDSGGGIFGSNAQLVLEVPEKGDYTIEVGNASYNDEVGGYFVEISETFDKTDIAEPVSVRTFVTSKFGKMERYHSRDRDFEVLFPASWKRSFECGEATACFGTGIASFAILEENLIDEGITDMGLEEYVEISLENLEDSLRQFELISREAFTNTQGLVGARLEYGIRNGRYKTVRIIYVKDQSYAFNALYVTEAGNYSRLDGLFNFSLESFRVRDRSWTLEDAADYFAEGQALAADSQHVKALEAFTRALEINPYHVDTYLERADIHAVLDDKQSAIADLNSALIQEAGRHEARYQKSLIHYSLGEFETSLDEVTRAIRSKPYSSEYFHSRALIRAAMADFALALKDISTSVRLDGGGISPSQLDTRAYVQLLAQDYENAGYDYEKALEAGSRTPSVLLGAGIVYHAAEQFDEAIELINEGIALLPDQALVDEDPRLVELQNRAKAILNN